MARQAEVILGESHLYYKGAGGKQSCVCTVVTLPELGGQKKTRTLHQNLLLLVNELLVRTQPHSIKPVSQDQHQSQSKRQRVTKTSGPLQDRNTTDSENDQSTGDYWIRIPVWERDIHLEQPTPSQGPFNLDAHSTGVPRREEQIGQEETTEAGPAIQPEQDAPDIEHFSRGDEAEERIDPETGDRQRGTVMAERHISTRYSTRQNIPRRLFTYETLGLTYLEAYPLLSAVRVQSVPYTPMWNIQYCTPPPAIVTGYSYPPSTLMTY